MQSEMTRRGFHRSLGAGALAGAVSSAATPGPRIAIGAVGVTPQCFTVGGQPVFLASAEMHYTRIPHQLWRDRILRAKRAGMNCVATYVHWNVHERQEGVFDFQGDADIERYIDLCQELGMYFFARVGPFVSGEWEAGGYPGWLLGKAGTEVRTANEATRPYIRRWFEQLIPRIARRQVTRGGPVILVQMENEYPYVNRAEGEEYLGFLIQIVRELGIEVPVSDCNGLDLKIPSSFKTLNGLNISNIRRHRKEYPGDPIFLSEFYPGWLECWGWPNLAGFPPMLVTYQQALWVLAEGAMFNYYVFHGGTHFEHWAARTAKSDDAFIMTRYYSEAPLAEGGTLSERYFAAKSGGVIAANFHDFFATAEPVAAPLAISGPVRASALRSPRGVMQFILPQHAVSAGESYRNDGRPPFLSMVENRPLAELNQQPGALRLPSGRVVSLAEGSAYPIMTPVGLTVDTHCRIDYSNATVFGLAGTSARRTLLLRGEAGRSGIISVNGREVEFVFPVNEPSETRAGAITILALPRELADRTWFAEDSVLIGPAFVGDQRDGAHECSVDGSTSRVVVITPSGERASHAIETTPVPLGLVRLACWSAHPLPELAGGGEWRNIAVPKPAEELGVPYGYTWYRSTVRSEAARKTSMYAPNAADRIHAFRGGKRVALFGVGPGATRDPFEVELARGDNEFIFLCDNMGRSGEGKKASDFKGIFGDVYIDVAELPLGGGELLPLSEPPIKPGWEFSTFQAFPPTEPSRFFRMRFRVPRIDARGAVLSLRWVPQYAWIHANGRLVGEHLGDLSLIGGFCASTWTLEPFLNGRELELDIAFFGEPMRDTSSQLRLFTYSKDSALTNWRFKGWERPDATGAAGDTPVVWQCEFPLPALPGPLFWVYEGLTKGHAWLNEHSLGNYWDLGPQRSLYMPEPWFSERNQLTVVEETGKRPDGTYIVRDPRYPVKKVLI
jgi:Glycosyl hydrolases family 35